MKLFSNTQKHTGDTFSGITCQTNCNQSCIVPTNSRTAYISCCSRCSPNRNRSKKNLKICDNPKRSSSVIKGDLSLNRYESTSNTLESKKSRYEPRPSLLKSKQKAMLRTADYTTKTGLVAHTTLGRVSAPSTIINRKPSTISRKIASRSVTGTRTCKYPSSGTSSSRIPTPRIPTPNRRGDTITARNDKALLSADSRRDKHGGDHAPRDDAAVRRLKSHFQDKCLHYEKLKGELNEKQKLLLELYNDMVLTHKEMGFLGQNLELPPPARIMNTPTENTSMVKIKTNGMITSPKVAKLNSRNKFEDNANGCLLPIDRNKMEKLSEGLISTCEQTLGKRKEIIDWLHNLVNAGIRGIKMNSLVSKVNEYLQENHTLASNLESAKADFQKNVNEIISTLSKNGLVDTVGLQLRIEQQTYELSELQAQISNMKKRVQMEHLRSNPNRLKIEELEKELKEEKCKRMILQDRLTRAENQAKNLSHVENELQQQKQRNWELERSIDKLNEENQQLQRDFDDELLKLTESITQNTASLEEISEAREKLHTEKEELEKKLQEISSNYKNSLKNLKIELSSNIVKVIEVEKKYANELEEKKKMETKVESLLNQLLDAQQKIKVLNTQLEERENDKKRYTQMQSELSDTREEFLKLQDKVKGYKEDIHQQDLAIDDMKKHIRECELKEERLKYDLSNKDDYIQELEKKQSQLERQLHESELKMTSYEQQLDSLRNNLTQLREVFGNFDNVKEVRDMMEEQREQLIETARKNAELLKALEQKDYELARQQEAVEKQEVILEQNEETISRLTAKEQEHYDKINSLLHALEDKVTMDTELKQKLNDKKTEIEYLETELTTRNQQIAQLKNIIQSFEEQVREASRQKRIEEDKICELEKKIAEYDFLESQRKTNAPGDNLDNLIKLLEDELQVPIEDPKKQLMANKSDCKRRKNYIGDYMSKNVGSDDQADYEPVSSRPSQEQSKMGMSNYGKKNYTFSGQNEAKPEKLDRKKAIMHIDSPKWSPENLMSPHKFEKQSPTKVFGSTMSSIDKTKYSKMLKFAGHRL